MKVTCKVFIKCIIFFNLCLPLQYAQTISFCCPLSPVAQEGRMSFIQGSYYQSDQMLLFLL